MAQGIEVFTAILEDLNSVPTTRMVEGQNQFLIAALRTRHTGSGTCPYHHQIINVKKKNNFFKLKTMPEVVADTFNPSTWNAEVNESPLSLWGTSHDKLSPGRSPNGSSLLPTIIIWDFGHR